MMLLPIPTGQVPNRRQYQRKMRTSGLRKDVMPLHSCQRRRVRQLLGGRTPQGLAEKNPKPFLPRKCIPSPAHPWKRLWKRTFLNCAKQENSTLR